MKYLTRDMRCINRTSVQIIPIALLLVKRFFFYLLFFFWLRTAREKDERKDNWIVSLLLVLERTEKNGQMNNVFCVFI